MASASATALAWSPLPRRPFPHSRVSVSRVRIFAISSSLPRSPQACCSNSTTTSSSNSTFRNFVLRTSFCSPSLDARLAYSRLNMKRTSCRVVPTRAGMRLDPGGGSNGNGGVGRVVVNLALAGGLTYLTLTGKLGWVFDTLISLWLLAVVIPVVSFIAFLWFAEREIVKGACPNCGQSFQVFEFAVKQEPNLCPYCSQPFKLDSQRQFVRDEPRFSNGRSGSYGDGFGGFGGFGREASSPRDQDPGGVIVDVEAEVVDRD